MKILFSNWISLSIFSFQFFADGLKLTELVIPSYVDIHEEVTLSCRFDLEGLRLYSVKWYKDEFEFFRFMPEYSPQTQIFPRNGVTLDESISDKNSVTMISLTFESSGTYKCEVSSEAPDFKTVFGNGNMTVMALPHSNPIITGIRTSYMIGDYINGNCTASPSFPASKLSWYINGVKVDKEWTQETPLICRNDLYSQSLLLRFPAKKRHFQGPYSILDLSCRVTISGLPPWETVTTLRLASSLTNQKLAQLSNRGMLGSAHAQLIILLGAVICLWCFS